MEEKDEEIHYCVPYQAAIVLHALQTELNSLIVSPTIEKPEVLFNPRLS